MTTRPAALLEDVLGEHRPGLPVVLCGPSGSGRTVLCLQQVHAQLARGQSVALLTAEPPRLLLQQAASLGVPLDASLEQGRLRLLELEPDAPASLRAHGGGALGAALLDAAPDARLVVIDPLSTLTVELLDEAEIRAVLRDLFDRLAAAERSALLTAELEAIEESPALGRALRDSCGVFVELLLDGAGHALRVAKSRTGAATDTRVPFAVGPGGPRAGPALPPPPVPSETPSAIERPRLLVVEDDGVTRAILQDWLGVDYEVELAADGFAAITAILQRRPDLVVLDLHLPRADGYEVLRALRGAGVQLPVLVVSGTLARASDRIRSLVLGATDLMPKPLQRFELLHRVETLLRLAPAPDDGVELPDVVALLDPAGGRRLLRDEEFRERLDRACVFGRRFGLTSSLVAVEAPSADALDALVGRAERRLRPEDAALAVSKTRLVLLLVACPPEQVPGVLRRLTRGGEEATPGASRLRLRAREATAPPDGGWAALFEDLSGWP